ncbi:protein YgfX [Imhoffiella purpurea]|uniref:Toxin CptA n=1 Tax=Imhoffiella purpurea TaxID=1249627 RepID=W9VTA9_9GAMM|nr:protein YgfX [Imhoffiella purpurea]EXJ13620.1 hypothetical protein D779_3512 [Imhoffiella purpurea]
MGSHRDRPPLVLRPGPSRRFLIYALAVHSAAAMLLPVLPIGWWRLALLLPILLSAIHLHAVHLSRRAPWSVVGLVWESDGAWTLTLRSGRRLGATLLHSTFVSLGLVVLRFRVGRWWRLSVPLFADALEPERMRRLRVLLNTEGRRLESQSLPAA